MENMFELLANLNLTLPAHGATALCECLLNNFLTSSGPLACCAVVGVCLCLPPNKPLQVTKALIDMENMFELLATEPRVQDEPHAGTLQVSNGTVEFKQVGGH